MKTYHIVYIADNLPLLWEGIVDLEFYSYVIKISAALGELRIEDDCGMIHKEYITLSEDGISEQEVEQWKDRIEIVLDELCAVSSVGQSA